MHDYRRLVSVWFRSIWMLAPRGDLMAQATLYYQVHVSGSCSRCLRLGRYPIIVQRADRLTRSGPTSCTASRGGNKHELIGSAPRRRG